MKVPRVRPHRTFVAAATAILASLLASAMLAAGCGGSARAETLVIYSSMPLRLSADGAVTRDIVKGEQMALEDAHARSGGYRIRFVSLDDSSAKTGTWSPQVTKRNAEAAADNPYSIAYLGELHSGATAISMPVLNRAGLLQVSPGSTATELTRPAAASTVTPRHYQPTGTPTFARVVQSDRLQALALVLAARREGISKVFVMHDGQVHGIGLYTDFINFAEAQGIEVVAGNMAPTSRSKEMALARRVKVSGAQGVLYAGVLKGAGVPVRSLLRAIGKTDPDVKFFGTDGVASDGFMRGIGPLQRRTFVTSPTVSTRYLPAAGRRFVSAFQKRYGRSPDPYAIYGYEAMDATLDAIAVASRGGTRFDPAEPEAFRRAVIRAFMEISDRESVLGKYSIDRYGDTTLDQYGLYTGRRGHLVAAKPIRGFKSEPS